MNPSRKETATMNKKNGLVSGDMMQKQQFDTKTLRRLLSYMKDYKGQLIFVVVCILLSAIASAVSALFLQSLIDDYIAPLLTSSAPVFTQLLNVLVVIGAVYLIGVLATLFYNRVMVTIAQGTLKKIRDEMFEKMQRLPIRAFDTRTDGDIMSLYTNDTDTLRQMIAQSMAQLISSVFTIVAVFICMLYQCVADACCSVHYVFDFADCKNDNEQNRNLFCNAAKKSCRCERLCGRNGKRTKGY